LKEAGIVEGQNVTVEYRDADNQPGRLPALVADLISRPVSAIVGNNNVALVAKAATSTVPIVFATGSDPVKDRLVASLNEPGGNVTGVSFFSAVLGAKRLELLRQVAPKATVTALLVGMTDPQTEAERKDVEAAARAIGQQLIVFDVGSEREIEAAFATFGQHRVGALLVGSGGFLNTNRERIAALADRLALPASYSQREGVVAGGLMSYGTSISGAYHQVGLYVARILRGEKPADLPVVQSAKFELVLSLKAAKKLGLDVPDRLLALADEVIE
jgi:putative ABC transport system substrate-binding protein